MSIIINPRGTGGAGKTELARRILAIYGWGKSGEVEPIAREGRTHPIGYRLAHPRGGRPLVVLGQYEATSGGCDTISLRDGGLDEVFRLADAYAGDGHDVLFEGLAVSREWRRSRSLAQLHRLHVLCLTTPLDECVRNLIRRRRMRRDAWPRIAEVTAVEHQRVVDACSRLQPCASVEAVSFDAALSRMRELLGLEPRDGTA